MPLWPPVGELVETFSPGELWQGVYRCAVQAGELLALRVHRRGHRHKGEHVALRSPQWHAPSSLPKAGSFFADGSLSFLLPRPYREKHKEPQPPPKYPSLCSTTTMYSENSLLLKVSTEPQGTCVRSRRRAA